MWKGGGTGAGAGAGAASQADEDAIHDLILQLDSLIRSSTKNYAQILKISDQVLELSPKDPDALNCKVVALINLDNVKEALPLINSAPAELDMKFKKAYCLYRLGRFDEVLNLLQSLEKSPAVLQLKAQTLYRTGDVSSCIETYEALAREFGLQSSEVKSNAVAAYVTGGKSKKVSEQMGSMQINPKTLSDLAYNVACVYIDQDKLTEAEEHLLLARRLGQETLLEDDWTQDEIEDELAPVMAQLAYVEQILGKPGAVQQYLALLDRDLKDKDLPTAAVVSNNLAALRKNKDASDSLRKLELFLKKNGKHLQFVESLLHKLSPLQKECIIYNYFLLLISTNKLNQARELLPSIEEEYRNSSMPVAIKACLYVKEGKVDQAEQALEELKSKDIPTEAYLLCAQARASAGQYLEAAEDLQRVSAYKHMPGIVATIVELKERGGDVQGAQKALDEAVEWWQDRMDVENSMEVLELLMRRAANLKLKNKDFKGAGDLFKRLAKDSSSNEVHMEAIAGLVRCCAETHDTDNAELYEKQLPALNSVDTDALEESVIVPSVKHDDKLQPSEQAAGADTQKKKRKRKARYPKGYDPENPGKPDPERWLPMRERSYYRPKKRDKRAMRGSQGAVAKDSSAAVSNGPSTSKASNGPSSSSKGGENKASSSSNKNRKKNRRG